MQTKQARCVACLRPQPLTKTVQAPSVQVSKLIQSAPLKINSVKVTETARPKPALRRGRCEVGTAIVYSSAIDDG